MANGRRHKLKLNRSQSVRAIFRFSRFLAIVAMATGAH